MEGIDWGSLGLGGGVFSMIAVIVVTLIKARSTDRTNILAQQAQHMDRLAAERNEAVKEKDEAYDEADKWRLRFQEEARKRIEAEAQAAAANATTGALKRQVDDLTAEVTALRGDVARLSAALAAGPTPNPSGGAA